jgi:hypothetical protein
MQIPLVSYNFKFFVAVITAREVSLSVAKVILYLAFPTS